MAASLGDLAPSEKKKVARLIQQVVEERSLRERDQAALAEQVAEQRALNEREQAVLAEQNTRLAGDNASLRSQLAHAFDLLRAYQLKCRALDTAVHTSNTGSQPASPGCASLCAAAATVRPLSETSPHPLMQHFSVLHRDAPCAAPELSAKISVSSGQPFTAAGSREVGEPHSAPVADGSSASHPQSLSAAPHLEALKVLAQALLEAQAAVAAKQHHQLLQQPSMPPSAVCGGGLGCAASVEGLGNSVIRSLPPESASVCSSFGTGDIGGSEAQMKQLERASGSERSAMAALGGGTANTPLLGAQSPASPEWVSSCSGRVAMFDESLMGMVRDVENMSPQWQQLNRGNSSGAGTWSQQLGGQRCSVWPQPEAAEYEENDLLALLESL